MARVLALLLLASTGALLAACGESRPSCPEERFCFEADFDKRAPLHRGDPVRVAGIDVGAVRGVENRSAGMRVKLVVRSKRPPLHRDAEITIRPRIFKEGAWFLDLLPGTPGTELLPRDGRLRATRTRRPVHRSDLLKRLQRDNRKDLQRFLRRYQRSLEGG